MVMASDEQYFHTIIMNSPEIEGVPPFAEFAGRGTAKYTPHHHFDPSHKKIYTDIDFEELKCSDKYFARKLTTDVSAPLMDRIDRELLGL
jgi:hypothetical protein